MVARLNFSHLPNFSNLPSRKVGKQPRVDVGELIQRKLPISTIQRKKVGGGKVKLKSIRVL